MQNVGLIGYSVFFLTTLLIGCYNLIYTHEVARIEKDIGIEVPPFIHSLLKIITVIAFSLALLIAFMALLSLSTIHA